MSKTGFISPKGSMSKTTAIVPGQGSKTRIELPSAAVEDATESSDSMDNLPPVVGWLVVVAGPGTGRSRELTFGLNSIGRGDDNRVPLNFGDTQISSDDHFRIAYDGRNKKFLISVGSGKNLVYIDEEPVLDARVISNGTEMSVGKTSLRFVSLCGDDWAWPDDD